MKSGLPHTVPLCSQAIDLLIDAQDRTGSYHGLIFPPQATAKHIHVQTSFKRIAPQRRRTRRTPRNTRVFADWSSHHENPRCGRGSHGPFPRPVVAAYLTDDYVEERIEVMQLWGDFLTDTTGPVINATPSEKGGTRPKIKSKDKPATRAEPPIAAVPGTDQPAGKPGNGTTAATAGPTPKRSNKAGKLATVNGNSPMARKQRIEALQKTLPIFAKTQT